MKIFSSHLGLSAILSLAAIPTTDGAVIVESMVSGASSSTINLNVNYDASGAASTPSPWFNATGSTTFPGAYGGVVGITLDAMSDVSTAAATLGDELVDGSFDVDGAGFLGVAGAPNSGGIGNGTNREGIRIIFDELTGISPTIGIRLTGISVQNVGRAIAADVGETFTIVNLLNRQSVTFNPVADGLSAGVFDVSSLNIYRVGGDSGDMATILSGDIGGFRVDGLTFETFAVPEPSIAILGSVGLLGLLRRRRTS